MNGLATLAEEIAAKGSTMPPNFRHDRLRSLIVERLVRVQDGTQAFTILPLGILVGRYSILDELQSQGAK